MDYMVVLVLTFYIYVFKYNPAISLLDIYHKKMKKKYMNSKILWTPMFTSALFTTAQTWKQSYLSKNESIKKMWHIHTQHIHIQRNITQLFKKRRQPCHLQQPGWTLGALHSVKQVTDTDIPYNLTYMQNLNKWKQRAQSERIGTRYRLAVARDRRWGGELNRWKGMSKGRNF